MRLHPRWHLPIRRSLGGVVATLLAIEVLDELVFGAREAAWPSVGGGLAFAGSIALFGASPTFVVLLAAFVVQYPASGAFVSLSQASLMDLEPERREHNMARWTLAGAVGAVAGPFLVATFAWLGLGWRPLFLAFAFLALGLVLLVRRAPAGGLEDERPRVRVALRALTRWAGFRWVFLLVPSDLLLDVFLGFVALYF